MKDTAKFDILLIGCDETENIGLKCISAFLKVKGLNSQIISYNQSNKAAVFFAIEEANPELVGFSLMSQQMVPDFIELIEYLRQKDIKAHFTLGGHYPTLESKKLLELIPGLDTVIRGEGELTIFELFHKYKQPVSWKNIEGLCYRTDNGEVKINTPRKLIENLDELPFPDREKFLFIHRDFKVASLMCSRGCYYNCSYCSVNNFYNQSEGQNRRTRSPQSVVKEMEYLYYGKGVNVFSFEDANFYVDTKEHREWTLEFIEELKEKRLAGNIAWKMSCRINDIQKDILKQMMEVGLISVYLGIESGNNTNLQIYNKEYTVSQIYKAIDVLTRLNLSYEFGFMLLNPYTTFETMKEDLDFLKNIGEYGTCVLNFTKMIPYSGTPIHNRLIREGRLTGSEFSPNYKFTDPRIDLLESFFHDAFHYRNFNKKGLVELLRFAKFDALLVNRFYPGIDTIIYQERIKNLTKEANQQLIETMSLAISLMESRNFEAIIKYWPILQNLVFDERKEEQTITYKLQGLLNNQLKYKYLEVN